MPCLGLIKDLDYRNTNIESMKIFLYYFIKGGHK